MKSKYYEELLTWPGAEEIKALFQQWGYLSQNLGEIHHYMPVILPDYLLLTPTGSGKSDLLRLIASYLDELRLMHFQGDQKVVEYHMGYCKPEERFYDLSGLADEISHAAGFHDHYCGIVALNCSEWIHHFDERHIKELLEYIRDNTRDWLVFIIVDSAEVEEIDHIEVVLSSFLRLNVLHLPYPETTEMVDYIEKDLLEYNISIDPDAKELLSHTIDILKEKQYFSGYWTLEFLVQEILYTIYSSKEGITKCLTPDILAPFAPEGEYTRQLLEQYTKRKIQKIGF